MSLFLDTVSSVAKKNQNSTHIFIANEGTVSAIEVSYGQSCKEVYKTGHA